MNLKEIGPSLDLKLRKIQLANEDMYRISLKQPKVLDASKRKNIETNALGEKRGRVHMAKQNLNTMALKNYKKILGKRKKIGEKNGYNEEAQKSKGDDMDFKPSKKRRVEAGGATSDKKSKEKSMRSILKNKNRTLGNNVDEFN